MIFRKKKVEPQPENTEKQYTIRVAIVEDGVVIYEKTSQTAHANSRLVGVQMLETEAKIIWKNLMRNFHIVHNINEKEF